MKITAEVSQYLHRSVLCWLATSSTDNVPNVSPKEVFFQSGEDKIAIANIASPQSVQNIGQNSTVCVSFIDILVQKGFQLKGEARIISKAQPEFPELAARVKEITADKFPFSSVTEITVNSARPIIAPSYLLFPETTEQEQTENAKRAYGFDR